MQSIIVKVCKIPIFKTISDDNLKKYYLLGVLFLRIQIFKKSKKYSLFGLPILKLFYSDNISKFCNINQQQQTMEKLIGQLNKNDIVKESDFAFLKSRKTNKEKSAVFGVLPPEKTGIAIFNHNAFVDCDYFDMFSDIRDLSVARGLSKNVFDLKTFIKFDINYLYKKFIYILGNSSHNNPYLNMAKNSIDKQKSWLYIHEANLN
ncbi:hypothetical protein EWK62_09275, partial [Campylobacter jejuni]|nr:hypothetical protein [Campylobacter jejuni]